MTDIAVTDDTAGGAVIEFLLARFAEDEAVARSIAVDPQGVARQRLGEVGKIQWLALTVDRPWADGIARVLAEVAAKRRIVEECTYELTRAPASPRAMGLALVIVYALVQPYADHPDCDPQWRRPGWLI